MNIIKFMKTNNATARTLSIETGIADSTLSYILNGDCIPRLDNANKIAAALGITLDKLFELLKEGEKE